MIYTPVNHSFTIWKKGLKGSKLYRYVFVMLCGLSDIQLQAPCDICFLSENCSEQSMKKDACKFDGCQIFIRCSSSKQSISIIVRLGIKFRGMLLLWYWEDKSLYRRHFVSRSGILCSNIAIWGNCSPQAWIQDSATLLLPPYQLTM